MRTKVVIPIILFALLILVVLFLLRPKQSVTITQPVLPIVQATNQLFPASVFSKKIVNASVISSTSTQKQTDISNTGTPEGFKRYVERLNEPIEFYGKVVDQDSNALAGAKIRIGVSWWTVTPTTLNTSLQGTNMEAISDVNGRFEFHGATGDGFGVGITKDGYELEPNRYGFGPTVGSYENPVVFKMWSTNIHEQLITGSKKFPINPDGRPYFINLTDGTISESGAGDLKVWIKRPEPITSRRYDWSCEVDVINGGLQPALDYTMYLAPTDGYNSSFQFTQTIGSGWGDSTGERRFYITLNNGQEYGHITIELYAYYNNRTPGLIRLSYAINPSGSRILR